VTPSRRLSLRRDACLPWLTVSDITDWLKQKKRPRLCASWSITARQRANLSPTAWAISRFPPRQCCCWIGAPRRRMTQSEPGVRLRQRIQLRLNEPNHFGKMDEPLTRGRFDARPLLACFRLRLLVDNYFACFLPLFNDVPKVRYTCGGTIKDIRRNFIGDVFFDKPFS
jgi:hypothetical protein